MTFKVLNFHFLFRHSTFFWVFHLISSRYFTIASAAWPNIAANLRKIGSINWIKCWSSEKPKKKALKLCKRLQNSMCKSAAEGVLFFGKTRIAWNSSEMRNIHVGRREHCRGISSGSVWKLLSGCRVYILLLGMPKTQWEQGDLADLWLTQKHAVHTNNIQFVHTTCTAYTQNALPAWQVDKIQDLLSILMQAWSFWGPSPRRSWVSYPGPTDSGPSYTSPQSFCHWAHSSETLVGLYGVEGSQWNLSGSVWSGEWLITYSKE